MRQTLEYKSPADLDYLYGVLIKQENGNHYCHLVEYVQKLSRLSDISESYKHSDAVAKYYSFVQFVQFDIDTVIGDFLNICTKNGYSENWKRHPFFFGRDFSMYQVETMPPTEMRYVSRMRPSLPFFYQDLNGVFETQDHPMIFTIDDFEIVKSFYGIQLNYEVLFKDQKELEKFPRISIESIPEQYNFAIGFRRFSYGLNHIDDMQILQKSEKLYSYTCSSLSEILFSVWHYCVVNGFKFVHCQHCGRLFATQSLKDKYCSRNSPYPGYESYECKTAIKRIEKKLKDRKRSIYENWLQKYGGSSDLLLDFLEQCAKYKDLIKDRASVGNYQMYERYLYSDKFPRKWSQRKSKPTM